MKNHLQSVALISSALSIAFLSGCETNPAVNNIVKTINSATAPTANTAPPSAQIYQKRAEASVAKSDLPAKTLGSGQDFVADKRVESTGLLGKTLTSKKKFAKSWGGELPFFNAYMAFPVTDGKELANNTNVLQLRPDIKNMNKAIFSYVKGDTAKAYFIDMLEVNIPKGYTVQSSECTGGIIGLFSYSNINSRGNYEKPIKAWNVVNGRFNQLTNISKMECANNDGDS